MRNISWLLSHVRSHQRREKILLLQVLRVLWEWLSMLVGWLHGTTERHHRDARTPGREAAGSREANTELGAGQCETVEGRGRRQWAGDLCNGGAGVGCIGHARGMGGVGRRWVLARGVGRCLRALCVRLCRAVEPTERRAEAGVGAAFERACAEGRGCWREAMGSGRCGGVCEGGLGSAGGARGGGRGRGEESRRA